MSGHSTTTCTGCCRSRCAGAFVVVERWPPLHNVNTERQQLVGLVVERQRHMHVFVEWRPFVHNVGPRRILHGRAETAARGVQKSWSWLDAIHERPLDDDVHKLLPLKVCTSTHGR